jgi:hypothetical protein
MSADRVYVCPFRIGLTFPMSILNDAHRLLCDDLFLHLDEAEALANEDYWSEQELGLARTVIPNLVTVIRGIVALHDDGPERDCSTCGGTWPCKSFETIHKLVKDPDGEFVKIIRARLRESVA